MRTGKIQLAKRLALLVALLCFWCSSGAALHHTDDLNAFRTFAAGHSVLGQSSHADVADADGCAACQWEQTVPTLYAPSVRIDQPSSPLTALVPCAAASLHLLAFDHYLLRAPPSTLIL